MTEGTSPPLEANLEPSYSELLEPMSPASSRWNTTSVTPHIVRAVATVGVLSVLPRLAMAGRDISLAEKFGTNAAVDAFVVALVLPLFAIQIISGAIPSALVPTYSRVEEQDGTGAGHRLVAGTITLTLGIIVAATVVLAALSGPALHLIGSGFDAHKLALTRSLFLALLPMLAFGSLAIAYGAILNAHQRFALAAASPTLPPLVGVVFLIAFPDWGVHGLAWGMTIGALAEAIVLAIALCRTGISPVPGWSGYDANLRAVARQYAPASAGALLLSSTVVVDQAFAGGLKSGAVSALNYGGKVVSTLVGIGTVAIGTVLLPHVSAIAARRDWAGLRRTVRGYALLASAIAIPVTIAIIVFSKPLVSVLFERGAFTASDTDVVAHVQALAVIQVPFFMLAIIAVRTLSALRRNQVLFAISALNVVTNLVGDIVFGHLYGVAGIAFSTSVVYVIMFVALFVMLARVVRGEERADAKLPAGGNGT